VATIIGNRINAPVTHDDAKLLREHPVACIAAPVYLG